MLTNRNADLRQIGRRFGHDGMWSTHVIVKYFALQLVGWAFVLAGLWLAAEIFAWPKAAVWIAFAAWAAKDIALYPLVWRAYDERNVPTAHPRQGDEGFALSRLDPFGSVRIGGERWRARTIADARISQSIDTGERVRVVGREGMTLLVERADARSSLRNERESA